MENIVRFGFLKIIMITIIVLFCISMLFIFLYSIAQAQLVFRYIKAKRKKANPLTVNIEPLVTIQLPVYNERYVVERLIDAVLKMNYPKNKLEIQVLDDSTDDTTSIISDKIQAARENGFDIVHIHRVNRVGYKAGALKEAMDIAKGEFIAIFDADFIPDAFFLRNTLSHFTNDKIGMVQTRWEHLNKEYSLLTKLQAFGLDAHFTIEQKGRNVGGSFINFNGTAGIWRKSCIYDAGNWHADTLTEDFDLSYRAQLNGWKFVYLEDITSPAELPPVMGAIKSQQYRWTKGGAENARKLLWKVMKSDISLNTKFHAFFHLMNSAVFISIILSALLSVPMLLLKPVFPEYKQLLNALGIFLFSFVVIGFLYFVSSLSTAKKNEGGVRYFFKTFPMFLMVSMGLSLHNAIAVIEGYVGRKSPFIRTPKFNVLSKNDKWENNNYIGYRISLLTVMEGVLALYFLFGIIKGLLLRDFSLLIYHAMLFVGFSIVFYYSVFQSKYSNQ